MTDKHPDLEREFLSHWCRLSQVQQRALLALSHEILIACDLVEESVEALTAHFLGLATTAKNMGAQIAEFQFTDPQILHQSLMDLQKMKNLGEEQEVALAHFEKLVSQNEANQAHQSMLIAQTEMLAAGFESIVTGLQFQDRTSQRLSVISDALQSVAALVVKVHDETLERIVLSQEDQVEDEWLQELVREIHLGEIRERFIKHALFDKCDTLFADILPQQDEPNGVQPDDDIELF